MRLAALVLAFTTTACSFMSVHKPRSVTPAGQVHCTTLGIAPGIDALLAVAGIVTIIPVLLSAAIFIPSARYGFRHTARCKRLRDAVRDSWADPPPAAADPRR